MITLTPKQEEVLMIVSEQEGRHPMQMLSLLMDNGVDFWYCDRCSPFESKRGTITDITGTGLWQEAQDFHSPNYSPLIDLS
tara:strand:+ start:418 stop:660 length:243 start_codon:yes stop_codon:yes gene_type:complete